LTVFYVPYLLDARVLHVHSVPSIQFRWVATPRWNPLWTLQVYGPTSSVQHCLLSLVSPAGGRAHSSCSGGERNLQRFRGGLVFKAHRLWFHSTLGLREIKKVGRAHSSSEEVHRLSARPGLSLTWNINSDFKSPRQRITQRCERAYRGTSLIRKRPPP